MRTFVRKHAVLTFFVLAYAFTWSSWIPMVVRGQMVQPGRLPTHFPGLLGPAFAALVVTAVSDGATGIRELLSRLVRWRIGGWLAFALLSPIALWSLAAIVLAIQGTAVPTLSDFGIFPGLPATTFVVVFLAEFLINGYGEETGWRGFALPRLQQRRSALMATLILAPLWAGWHLPMLWINVGMRGMSPAMMGGFVVGITCGAFVLTWLYIRSGQSVLATALWHASYNMVSATAAAAPAAAIVTTGVIVGAIAILICDRATLARRSSTLARTDRGCS
jgi:membrane protease YdiL (CAAX protease family)